MSLENVNEQAVRVRYQDLIDKAKKHGKPEEAARLEMRLRAHLRNQGKADATLSKGFVDLADTYQEMAEDTARWAIDSVTALAPSPGVSFLGRKLATKGLVNYISKALGARAGTSLDVLGPILMSSSADLFLTPKFVAREMTKDAPVFCDKDFARSVGSRLSPANQEVLQNIFNYYHEIYPKHVSPQCGRAAEGVQRDLTKRFPDLASNGTFDVARFERRGHPPYNFVRIQLPGAAGGTESFYLYVGYSPLKPFFDASDISGLRNAGYSSAGQSMDSPSR